MKAFGTFKGGGVKGLAHVGAYKAAQDKGITFVGVAGTSAGAIVAALIAVGYDAVELYEADPELPHQAGPFSEPYTQFFDMTVWNNAKFCQESLGDMARDLGLRGAAPKADSVPGGAAPTKREKRPLAAWLYAASLAWRLLRSGFPTAHKRFLYGFSIFAFLLSTAWVILLICSNVWGRALLLAMPLAVLLALAAVQIAATTYAKRRDGLSDKLFSVMTSLAAHRGLFATQNFTDWLDKLLEAKIGAGSGENGAVLFRDIQDRMPLKIIAANITDQRMTVFSQQDTPDAKISDAVAASISIPLVFQPKSYRNREYVDGGLVSNNPAWALDEERVTAGMGTPTLVFNLEERKLLPSNSAGLPFRFLRFLAALTMTLFVGGEELQYRQVGNLRIIPLRVDVSTLDIELDDKQRRALYNDGFHQAKNRLEEVIGPRNPIYMEKEILPYIKDDLLRAIGLPEAHLRVAVLLNLCKNSRAAEAQRRYLLRVCYSFGMEEDSDDQLELDLGSGGAGKCWQERRNIFVDMAVARNNYRTDYSMTKYQQALVRPSLKGLLCLPILADERNVQSNAQPGNVEPLLGVLCLDTDDAAVRDIFERICPKNIFDPRMKVIRDKALWCARIVGDALTS